MLILYKGFINSSAKRKKKKNGIKHFSKIKTQGPQLSKCQKKGYFQPVNPLPTNWIFFYSAGTGENPVHDCNTVRKKGILSLIKSIQAKV